ncbi:WecB/TagA/CpsF family glycosyltransferase [Chitinophaga sp. XS-30]|uniref:WecB/TagA/CpsF family glycosyltransferase n=1 Tax=Chitinophaga sp. XS-30 TaxID=2604421 RepID=UPI0011DE0133|nr:WecB/TagA/CpsF family glycosyltransferase [Chitinophaga sp. XS-30]QEH41868.1 WecB/TagA/CpsF family glycosyltransferase [Chitinophaga sp. XS-30]
MTRTAICNIPVDVLTMQQTLDHIEDAITRRKQIQHVVINAAKVVHAQKDPGLRNAIVNCDIINADGQSIVWASRFLGKALPERVAGIDLMEALIALAGKKRYKIFLLGAKEEVVKKVADIYTAQHGAGIIAGYRNGYFKPEEEAQVAAEIAVSGADMLFVAITSPKKELFLDEYNDVINIPFTMGVGGSFDVVAGLTKRAPRWMQRIGMEWFYRLAQEPRRMWKRYLIGNSAFIYLVLKEKLKFKH